MEVKKSSLKKYWFPGGSIRYIHVSRGAIIQNTKHKKNHPTILVIDSDGQKYLYHHLILRGPSMINFSHQHPEIDAHVYIMTEDAIEAYYDLAGDSPNQELSEYQMKSLTVCEFCVKNLRSIKRRISYFFYGRPVSWCKDKI